MRSTQLIRASPSASENEAVVNRYRCCRSLCCSASVFDLVRCSFLWISYRSPFALSDVRARTTRTSKYTVSRHDTRPRRHTTICTPRDAWRSYVSTCLIIIIIIIVYNNINICIRWLNRILVRSCNNAAVWQLITVEYSRTVRPFAISQSTVFPAAVESCTRQPQSAQLSRSRYAVRRHYRKPTMVAFKTNVLLILAVACVVAASSDVEKTKYVHGKYPPPNVVLYRK